MVDCEQLINSYGSEILERIAVMEILDSENLYKEYKYSAALNEKTSHTGASACYCKDLYN